MLQTREENIIKLALNNKTEKLEKLFKQIILKNNSHEIKNLLEILEKYLDNGHTLLLIALKNGHESLSKLLIDYGSDINAQCKHPLGGYTPLHIAFEYFLIKIATLLLDGPKINVNLEDHNKNLPLHTVCNFYKKIIEQCEILEDELLDIIKTVIAKTFNIDHRNYKGYTATHISIIRKNSMLCKLLLNNGANISLLSQEYDDYLTFAIRTGHLETVQVIMKNYHEKNITFPKDSANNNLIHIASAYSSTKIVKVLLDHRKSLDINETNKKSLDINERNNASLTPLGNALLDHRIENAKLLIKENADIKSYMATAPFKTSYLHYVINETPDEELIELLISHGVDLNTQSGKESPTALQISVIKNQLAIFTLIAQSNADLYIKDAEGNTVLHHAIQNSNPTTYIRILLEREKITFNIRPSINFLINTKNNNNDPPLHMALQSPNAREILPMLLEFPGINVNIPNKIGLTALHSAIRQGYNDLAYMLIQHGAKMSSNDTYKRNAFHHAASTNNMNMIKYFIAICASNTENNEDIASLKYSILSSNSSELEIVDISHKTLLITKLVLGDHWKEIRFLAQHSAKLRHNNTKNTLWMACKELIILNQHDYFLKLIKEFPHLIRYTDEKNLTLIHYLISHTDNFNVLNFIDTKLCMDTLKDSKLLSLLIKLNKKDTIIFILNNNYQTFYSQEEESPLFTAFTFNKDLCKFLLHFNFYINGQNTDGDTLLHLAIRHNEKELLSQLLSKNADLNIPNKYGKTPIFETLNNLEALEMLLKARPIINIKNRAGFNPLALAAKKIEKNRDVVITLLSEASNRKILNDLLIESLDKINERNFIYILNILIVHQVNLNNIIDEKGRNILHYAISTGRSEISELIIFEKLIDIDQQDAEKNTPLNFAIKFATEAADNNIKMLIKNNASLTIEDSEGKTPLINSILHEKHKIMKSLLSKSLGDITIQNLQKHFDESYEYSNIQTILKKLDMNDLSIAILYRNHTLFNALLETKSMYLNKKDLLYGYTPLHCSVIFNAIEATKKLLQEHANIDALDNKGRSPLFYAFIEKNSEIIKLLLSEGAKIFLRDIYGLNILYYGIQNNFLEGIGLLQQQSDNIDTLNSNCKGAIHHAIELKAKDCLSLLLYNSANLDVYNFSKIPILHYATINNFSEGVKIILGFYNQNYDAINQKFRDNTPIMYAAHILDFEIFEELLPYSYLSIKNSEGLTAIDLLMKSLLSQLSFVFIRKFITHEEYTLLELPKIKIDTTEKGTQSLLNTLLRIWKTAKHTQNVFNTNTALNFLFLIQNLDELKKTLSTVNSLEERILTYQNFKNLALIYPAMQFSVDNLIQDEILQSILLPTNYLPKQELCVKNTTNKLIEKDLLTLLYNLKKNHYPQATTTIESSIQDFVYQETKLLIEKRNNPLVNHNQMLSLLHCATIINNLELVKLLVNENNVNQKTSLGLTPLFCSIVYSEKNNIEIIKMLLALNANVNATIENNFTPLHYLAMINYLEAIQLLVAYGADINAQNSLGCTALLLSICYNNNEIAKFLLSQENINTNSCDKYGNNAFLVAIEQNNADIVGLLLPTKEIDINHTNNEGLSPLILATIQNNYEIVNIILNEKGKSLEINLQDKKKKSALFYAISNRNLEITSTLLTQGADISIVDQDNLSPLEHCIKLDDKNLFNLLVEKRTVEILEQIKTGKIRITDPIKTTITNNKSYFKEKLKKILDDKDNITSPTLFFEDRVQIQNMHISQKNNTIF